MGADTSTRGHIAFGCALQRGVERADATTRHYADLAARELFRAALQANQRSAVAAQLWNATDEVMAQDTGRVRAELLATCAAAGFNGQAGLPELRSYMCAITADLAQDRPTLGSFGLEDTALRPGDPRRSDASFVGTAQFLLATKMDPQWLDAQNPAVALGNRNGGEYRAALRELAAVCAMH